MLEHNIYLGVNIDHVATLREARDTSYPDPKQAALIAEQAGANSITLHLREDRRHIQDKDVFVLKDMLKTKMNLEMAVTSEMLDIARKVKPQDCCLVPEKREELTTEGGLDVAGQMDKLTATVASLHQAGIRVSPFIDPDSKQVEAVAKIGAKIFEIHTGHYADATNAKDRDKHLAKIIAAARLGQKLGLQVNAGHGLNLDNVVEIAKIPQIVELNIGHALVAQAVFNGFAQAVADMKALMLKARGV